jgi:hypothetical protein
MSDNILPSQTPDFSDSPAPTNPLPQNLSANEKSLPAESLPLPEETRLSPEEREWARQFFPSMEEMEREVRELQEKGGFTFEDLEEIIESVRNGRDDA